MTTPMLKNHVNGCHGNHAFFHSAIEFIFEDKNSLHFWGPNERFGTHEKLSWGVQGRSKLAPGVLSLRHTKANFYHSVRLYIRMNY